MISKSDLTAIERELIEHALGLNRSNNATRNFYAAGSADAQVWDGLVSMGLAFEVANTLSSDRTFMVSPTGKRLFGVNA